MKKNKERFRFASAFLALLLPLLAAGCGYQTRTVERKMENILLLEEAADGSGICMVCRSGRPELVSDRYLIESEGEKKVYDTGESEYDYSSEIHTIHDLKDGTVYTVTAKEYNKALPKGHKPGELKGCFESQGKWYMMRYVAGEQGGHGGAVGDMRLLVELDSGTIQLTTPDDVREKYKASDADREYWRQLQILKIGNLFNANGLADILMTVRGENGFSGVESGEVNLLLSCKYLPEHNEALYEKFPGLKQYQGTDGRVEMHLKGWPDAEEILRLLLEDSQEISFEGVTVSAESSADGQEHKIESFEDWNKWKLPDRVRQDSGE